jgi:uncharacterized protein YecE (DUF72 family)
VGGRVLVGTSGWAYRGWRDDFYPRGLRQRDELAHLSRRMTSVEVNGSFYSLQRPTSYAAWRDATPDGFVLAVKGGRHLTHLKQLHDVATPLANFLASGPLELRDKLGPVLWQLPRRTAFDAERVDAFLRLLPRTTAAAAELALRHDAKVPPDRVSATTDADRPIRHALEPRHESFGSPEALDLLRRHGVALVLSDNPGGWPVLDAVTADFGYARMHGRTELYASGYTDAELDALADRCRAWTDAGLDGYVYFDNDARGRAPWDAVALLDRLGLAPSGDR